MFKANKRNISLITLHGLQMIDIPDDQCANSIYRKVLSSWVFLSGEYLCDRRRTGEFMWDTHEQHPPGYPDTDLLYTEYNRKWCQDSSARGRQEALSL